MCQSTRPPPAWHTGWKKTQTHLSSFIVVAMKPQTRDLEISLAVLIASLKLTDVPTATGMNLQGKRADADDVNRQASLFLSGCRQAALQ